MQRSVKIRLLLGGIALCLFAWLMLGMRTQERSAIRLESEPVLAKEDAGKKECHSLLYRLYCARPHFGEAV